MVKLNNKKIKYVIDSILKDKHSTKELSEIYEVSQRWIQILVKKFKKTGEYPKLNRKRRPKTVLTDDQKELIEKEYAETFFGAMMLRHHIKLNMARLFLKIRCMNICLRKVMLNQIQENRRREKDVDMKEITIFHYSAWVRLNAKIGMLLLSKMILLEKFYH